VNTWLEEPIESAVQKPMQHRGPGMKNLLAILPELTGNGLLWVRP
jgi:hypothetical protein